MAALDDEILLVSTGGIVIRTAVREIAAQGRDATGVRLMSLEEGHTRGRRGRRDRRRGLTEATNTVAPQAGAPVGSEEPVRRGARGEARRRS